jgi:hypothetical protein
LQHFWGQLGEKKKKKLRMWCLEKGHTARKFSERGASLRDVFSDFTDSTDFTKEICQRPTFAKKKKKKKKKLPRKKK